MTEKQTFIKMHTELLALGLPRTLVALYGQLEFHAGKDGKCYPTHARLASEIGLKDRKHVVKLLGRLRALRLIEWTRGRYFNSYRVLNPDVALIRHQMSSGSDISDVAWRRHRKEEGQKNNEKSQPASHSARGKRGGGPGAIKRPPPEAGRLAELEAMLTEAWPKLQGRPGKKLLARVAGILDGVPLDEFRPLLASKQRRVESFGLAESLARDLITRRNGDETRRKPPASAPPPPVGPDPNCKRCGGTGAIEHGATVDFCPRCNAAKPKSEKPSARKGAA